MSSFKKILEHFHILPEFIRQDLGQKFMLFKTILNNFFVFRYVESIIASQLTKNLKKFSGLSFFAVGKQKKKKKKLGSSSYGYGHIFSEMLSDKIITITELFICDTMSVLFTTAKHELFRKQNRKLLRFCVPSGGKVLFQNRSEVHPVLELKTICQ